MPTVAELTEQFNREKLDLKVTKASDVPRSYDSLTKEWLTDVLCKSTPGAQVEAFHFGDRDDGSSNRRRIFLTYNAAGRSAGLPATVFCKTADRADTRVVLASIGCSANEVNFYNLVCQRADMETPRALYASYDPQNHAFFIMMEDLAENARFLDYDTRFDRGMAEGQLDNLAKLHGRFYQSRELGTDTLPFPTWYDWWKLFTSQYDIAVSCDLAFGETKDLMPARLFKRRPDIWPATLLSVERHRELPHTLIHCDVHPRNWYQTKAGKLGIGDWQIVCVGHWARDVAYAMTTALTIEDRRRWDKELVLFYLDRLAAYGGERVSPEDAWLNLRQQIFTALAFWTITLHPSAEMADMQPAAPTLEFLRRFYAAIDDYDALASFA